VTLPGGRIVVFDALITAARSPDEVAGVLAHEMGHVQHRDVLESLLRHVGLSVLLGGLDGQIGGYTNALLSSAYSRDAESRADGYAIDTLARAAVSPVPTADFFKRLSKGDLPAKGVAQVATYFSSHPGSGDRAARFVAAAGLHRADTPALDAGQWQQLRKICTGDTKVEKPGFNF
jgi:predicted Zn-dependent protease